MMVDELALLIADLFEAAGLFRKLGESIAAAEGQTQARWQLMFVVSETPLTVPQAARRLGTSRQNIQRVAHELVTDNILQTRTNPDHRRSVLLNLTAEGRRVLDRITERATQAHRIQTRNLNDADIIAHRAFLRRLIMELRDYEEAPAATVTDAKKVTSRRTHTATEEQST
jgi:DNA-binding MarR family transcriptional regulator